MSDDYESQALERKASLAEREEALEALCGMVNSDFAEGVVELGVGPDGATIGLSGNLDTAQRTISQAIEHSFEPRLRHEMRVDERDGKPILLLSARRDKGVSYFEFKGVAWTREGSRTRRLTLDEKERLNRARQRELHPGPWKCDRCGAWVGVLGAFETTETGPRRRFTHGCGGEFQPA